MISAANLVTCFLYLGIQFLSNPIGNLQNCCHYYTCILYLKSIVKSDSDNKCSLFDNLRQIMQTKFRRFQQMNKERKERKTPNQTKPQTKLNHIKQTNKKTHTTKQNSKQTKKTTTKNTKAKGDACIKKVTSLLFTAKMDLHLYN